MRMFILSTALSVRRVEILHKAPYKDQLFSLAYEYKVYTDILYTYIVYSYIFNTDIV